ncbi:transcriptional regulator family: Fungal Specific TF [Penicillium brevicompactum]|uniref:Transcriptional regulator family: Fungal Specific TF n=1 Tax=Penicillium brevicompactum TaxID=5074 RepID=A0A9W9UN86_PENBR|nr:transcriptional regulator family: Fungal Specific TF [Penicillium brevicompactum]
MKRSADSNVAAAEAPKRHARQDPVSCESCRKKKLKCDRTQPCSSCSARKIDCTYGGSLPGPRPSIQPSQTEGRPVSDSLPAPPRTLRWTPRQDMRTQIRNGDESLQTVDWLETIVMGHRVPSAVPVTLRAELSPRNGDTSLSQQAPVLGQAGNPPGSRIASTENPSTIHLPSYLPPLAEALGLFRYYCNYLDFQYHIIITRQVEEQIKHIYDCVAGNRAINLAHTALLFSITASALYYQLLGEASEHAEQVSQEATFLTGAALIQGNYIGYPTIEGLQATMIIGHQLSNLSLPSSVSSLFLHRSCVGQAISMRLHMIDSPTQVSERSSSGFQKTSTELKRRLWWDLASYDWLIGFLSGPQEWIYSIQPQHMVVNIPLNVEDEDIEQTHHNQQISIPTVMSYSLCRMKLAVWCRQVVEETSHYHLHGREVPYETILTLDRKLHKMCAEIPSFYRFDQNSRREFSQLYRDRNIIAWQRAMVQQGYYSRFCRLHRDYFVRGAKDPRYSYSHVVSLQSARKILETKRKMDEEEPVFKPHSSCVWSIMHHVFMAAAILLIDVCFNWDDILAERRKEEVLDACRMLSRAQQSSPIAREGINAMMGILRKHWKHEQRPVSRGLQNDPVPSTSGTSQISRQDPLTPVSMGSGSATSVQQASVNQSALDPPVTLSHDVAPLEDVWAEMLEGGVHAELDTPDWTVLWNELTNVTLSNE